MRKISIRIPIHACGLAVVFVLGFGGAICAPPRVRPDEFKQLPLQVQIEEWRQYRVRGGGSEINGWYLSSIADQGKPAADAMVPFLATPNSTFPVKDAITIVGFVAAQGVDLRDHPATARLRILMSDSPDQWIRKAAWSAIRTIDGVDPPWPEEW